VQGKLPRASATVAHELFNVVTHALTSLGRFANAHVPTFVHGPTADAGTDQRIPRSRERERSRRDG
jgi:hypothetical protein